LERPLASTTFLAFFWEEVLEGRKFWNFGRNFGNGLAWDAFENFRQFSKAAQASTRSKVLPSEKEVRLESSEKGSEA
jgi:hypothetical protein